MIRHALIMAGGRGLRMMPLTQDVPKAMVPFNGTTLIAQGISRIRPHVPNLHVTVGYQGAVLAEHVIKHGATTVINTEGRGNCWWVFNSFLSSFDEPVFVLTCDNVIELDWALLESEYTRRGAPTCMVVPVEPVEGVEGDYITQDGDVVINLSRTQPALTYCSGIQIINPRRVTELVPPCEDFKDLWSALISIREVRASQIYPSRWWAVDTLEDLVRLVASTGADGDRTDIRA